MGHTGGGLAVARRTYAEKRGRGSPGLRLLMCQAPSLWSIDMTKKDFIHHARLIPRWKYRFSSDQRSQAALGCVSTGVGDQPGTRNGLVSFFLFGIFGHTLGHDQITETNNAT